MRSVCNICGVSNELTVMSDNSQGNDNSYYIPEVWHSLYPLSHLSSSVGNSDHFPRNLVRSVLFLHLACSHSSMLELVCCALYVLDAPNLDMMRRLYDRLVPCYTYEYIYTKVVLFCCRWIPGHHRMESACNCYFWALVRCGELYDCQYIDPQHTTLVNSYHQLYPYWIRRPDFDGMRDVPRVDSVLTSSLPFVKGCPVDDTECDAFAYIYDVVGFTTHQSALLHNAIPVMLQTLNALTICSTLDILSLYDIAMTMLYTQKCAWEQVLLYQYAHGI